MAASSAAPTRTDVRDHDRHTPVRNSRGLAKPGSRDPYTDDDR